MRAGRRSSASLDLYLQPAVVGGGLGDIEEVLAVGRRLQRSGCRPLLYRARGRPLPPSVDGPWGWPAVRRVDRLHPRSDRALTVTPWWGVSAAPSEEGSRSGGAWSRETGAIERAYGPERVLHLSLEEFARTLTSREQTVERWREGGVATREIARRLSRQATRREVRAFQDAYRKWRAFDRANVLHLFTGFRPSRPFSREFPEAIQLGPLWPEPRTPQRRRRGRWVWYASPSTSDRLAAELARAFRSLPPGSPPVTVEVRAPRSVDFPSATGLQWRSIPPMAPDDWTRRFDQAEVRIVTGSRTLLEALAGGGPFLYFNGVLNSGRRTRRHRPEKIVALLEMWRRHGVPPELRADLADFSRLRRVPSIVRSLIEDGGWSSRFPPRSAAVGFAPPWDDAATILSRWARDWAVSPVPAGEFVRRCRETARAALSRL